MRRRSRQIQAATIILAGQRQLSWPVGSAANAGCREGRSLDRRPALAGDGGFKIPWRGRPLFGVEGGIAAHSTNRMSLDAEPSCDRPPGDALHDPFPTTRPGIRPAMAGFSARTARRIDKDPRLPSQKRQPRTWRTRTDPLTDVWPRVLEMLKIPGMMAVTIFEDLQDEVGPEVFPDRVRRT